MGLKVRGHLHYIRAFWDGEGRVCHLYLFLRKNGVCGSSYLVGLSWAGLGAASLGVKVGVF